MTATAIHEPREGQAGANVDIALATYNGMPYLEELLASLEAQSAPGLRVVASDDGSSDATLACLERQRAGLPIILAGGEPRGNILRNFENALKATSAPYVALCDQDDVWDHEKVAVLLERVRQAEARLGPGVPVLAFCDLEVVDRDLGTISPSLFGATRKTGAARRFRDYVLNNHVPGCAMLMNRALLEKALPYPALDIHDHWLIQIAALYGAVEFVDRPLIKYRQHGANNIGLGSAGRTPLQRAIATVTVMPRQLAARASLWRKQAASIRRNMAALRDRFGDTIPDAGDRETIRAVLAGDRQGMQACLGEALTGERTVDYYGVLWTLARAARKSSR